MKNDTKKLIKDLQFIISYYEKSESVAAIIYSNYVLTQLIKRSKDNTVSKRTTTILSDEEPTWLDHLYKHFKDL